MRLLVTRSDIDAPESAARLTELGHAVITEPLLIIEFTTAPRGTFKPGAIIFTSRNAVRAVESWPGAAAWRNIPVFAVGDETGRNAAKCGFKDVRSGAGNVAEVAALVLAEYDKSAGTILYPAADEVAADLDGMLSPQGIDLLQVIAYRAVASREFSEAARRAIAGREIDGAVVYSRRAAIVFRDLVRKAGLTEALAGVRFFALSESIGAVLRPDNADVRVAAQPNADSLAELIGPAAASAP